MAQLFEFQRGHPHSPQPGAGWYRLSAPAQGWAYSRLLSNTTVDASERQPECWARNLREGLQP